MPGVFTIAFGIVLGFGILKLIKVAFSEEYLDKTFAIIGLLACIAALCFIAFIILIMFSHQEAINAFVGRHSWILISVFVIFSALIFFYILAFEVREKPDS